MKNKFIAAVILVIALLAVSYIYSKYRVAPKVDFQTLELTDLNNNPVKLESYKGKKLFVNFFATWCGPCMQEIPQLADAQQALRSDNFTFICISDEPVARLQSFAQNAPSNLVILHSVKGLHALNIFTVPTSYTLDTNGKCCFKKVGIRDWNSEASLEQLKRETN